MIFVHTGNSILCPHCICCDRKRSGEIYWKSGHWHTSCYRLADLCHHCCHRGGGNSDWHPLPQLWVCHHYRLPDCGESPPSHFLPKICMPHMYTHTHTHTHTHCEWLRVALINTSLGFRPSNLHNYTNAGKVKPGIYRYITVCNKFNRPSLC